MCLRCRIFSALPMDLKGVVEALGALQAENDPIVVEAARDAWAGLENLDGYACELDCECGGADEP